MKWSACQFAIEYDELIGPRNAFKNSFMIMKRKFQLDCVRLAVEWAVLQKTFCLLYAYSTSSQSSYKIDVDFILCIR